MTIWQKEGPENDVVLSTRIRLARNYKDIAFPTSMNVKDSVKVKERTLNLLKELDEFKFHFYDFASISSIERITFVERHICSRELAHTPQMSALLLSQDESVSIMINEEDHIRAQILTVGLDYDKALVKANIIQSIFDDCGKMAHNDEIGYLTSCPTNLGTGMRASAMIRIPAISINGNLINMMNALKKAGFVLRGIYGEGSSSVGGIMQLSNARDVADSRDEIIKKVSSICMHIIRAERVQRNLLKEKKNIRMQDKIMRAYGILRYAKRITQREIGLLLGDIWLGKDIGLIKNIDDTDLLYLLTASQDATLQIAKGEEKNKTLLNIKRAEFIQEFFKTKECVI